MDFGQGVYVDEPEIMRGDRRYNMKMHKETFEIERDKQE